MYAIRSYYVVDGNVFTLFQFGIRNPMEPCSLDHDKVRAFVVLVITSYSIHYTKLYDQKYKRPILNAGSCSTLVILL